MKQRNTDLLIVGFALFSMFFGAGNIIFPPYLGMEAGSQWFSGFFCYYLADIGLAVVSIFAIVKCGGDVNGITSRIGKIPGKLLLSAAILCIGPLIAIPRTGATTYEMFVEPTFGNIRPEIPTILFFAIVLVLALRESSVIDILGKFLTPALFIGLMLLIIKGVLSPIGPIAKTPLIDNVVVSGVNAGYQTMDVLGSLAFGIIIVKTVAEKGYREERIQYKVVRGSSIIAAIGLLLVYCGLTYLGATASTLYGVEINRSQLIINIIDQLMGYAGVVVLGIVVSLACVTTAVALVSASAEFFSTLSGGRVKYKVITVITCLFSAFVSNFGIDQIVTIAEPILNLIYPGILTLIVLSFFSKQIPNNNVYRGATIGAMATSLCEILNNFGFSLSFITHLPLAALGFAWILPAVLFGIIGAFIPFHSNK